jgi:hypothetical protein
MQVKSQRRGNVLDQVEHPALICLLTIAGPERLFQKRSPQERNSMRRNGKLILGNIKREVAMQVTTHRDCVLMNRVEPVCRTTQATDKNERNAIRLQRPT